MTVFSPQSWNQVEIIYSIFDTESAQMPLAGALKR